MASLQYIAFASALFLVLLAHQAKALSCYQCNSYTDGRCLDNDNLPEDFKKPCGKYDDPKTRTKKEYTICRKFHQVIEFAVNELEPHTRVIRQCGWDNSTYQGRCYQRAGFGGRSTVCGCFDDYCNAGSSLQFHYVVGATILSAVLYFSTRV